MWALCDLAMSVLVVHTSTFETSPFSEIRISAMFFKRHEDTMFVNVKVYLPEKFQIKVSFVFCIIMFFIIVFTVVLKL